MDSYNSNRESRSTPQYGLYQRENFWKSSDEVPPFNAEPGKLEELAQKKPTQTSPLRCIFQPQPIPHPHRQPPVLLPTAHHPPDARPRTPSGWGDAASAPIGINKTCNEAGESPVARVAGDLNLSYCLSTAGSQPIEDVGAANDALAPNGKGGVRFFQLYMPHDNALTRFLLKRAINPSFTACILARHVAAGLAYSQTWTSSSA
ncbi:L-lactate dehydrogenase (FMN-dependent dehydrogenase) [Paraphaeosphaeria sporulosa]